jgi:multidrug efflux pump subunit AcrA (membrane-fusion protein)
VALTQPTETPPIASPAPRESLVVRIIRTLAPLVVIGLGVAGAILLAQLKPKPEPITAVVTAPLVKTTPLEAHTSGLTVDVEGVVVPFREITISAEIAGRVDSKDDRVKAGHFVRRGDHLLEFERRDYELDKERLASEYKQAGTMLDELDVEEANTKKLIELAAEDLALQMKEVERVKSLAGVLSASELDRAKRSELAARNALAQFENQLRIVNAKRARLESGRDLVGSQLEKAERDLGRTAVKSPIDGVIIQDMVEEDSYVQKGTNLLLIEDISAVEVRCQLRMDEIYWLWRQQPSEPAIGEDETEQGYQIPHTPATIVYELAGERFAWDGVLSRFDGIGLDEKTRTIPCRVLVEKPREARKIDAQGNTVDKLLVRPPALVRGMYVTVQLHADPQGSLYRVPELALRPTLSRAGGHEGSSLNAIWLVRDGKLVIEPVSVAGVLGDDIIISDDAGRLRASDQIIVTPLAEATDGMAVRLEASPDETGAAADTASAEAKPAAAPSDSSASK